MTVGFVREKTGAFRKPIGLTNGPSFLTGVNNAGTIAAEYTPLNTVTSAALISNTGAVTQYSFPGAFSTMVNGLTNQGALAGSYFATLGGFPAFIHPATGPDVSFQVPGSEGTVAQSINDAGLVVGSWSTVTPYGVHAGFRIL